MVFKQIWYLHKQGLQDQNKGITNCAEFTLQWRNYPIWRYIERKKNPKNPPLNIIDNLTFMDLNDTHVSTCNILISFNGFVIVNKNSC